MTTNTKPITVKLSPRFIEHLRTAPREIKAAFRETLQLFRDDPYHSALRNHVLHGMYAGYHSIDVTEDWRALYTEAPRNEDMLISFRLLGTHKQLYSNEASENRD